MIEVNLRPGGKKRAAGGGFSIPVSLPSADALPTDPWILGAVAAAIVALLGVGWLWRGTGAELAEVEGRVEQAVADSTRYADLIETMNDLKARRDSIAERVEIIQEIDAGRYIWAHIMDEVGGSLPDFTWITALVQTSGGQEPNFRVNGRTGNILALTRYMRDLEASAFVRDVQIISTQQVNAGGRVLHEFSLEAKYENPPMEAVETVPLFGAGSGQTTGAGSPGGGSGTDASGG